MGERKVLNKYYPPDFDPSKLPRNIDRDKKREPNQPQQHKVRMMLPMSIRCKTCGEFMGRGKKFNSRKETVADEDYFGIKIYRFYMFCTRCAGEFTIKTDPKNADYLTELGCTRNFEPDKAERATKAVIQEEQAEEEAGDAMKALENRTAASKREMDILDALDEIRSMNARASELDPDQLFENIHSKLVEKEQEELAAIEQADEEEIKEVFALRRLDGEEAPAVDAKLFQQADSLTERIARPTAAMSVSSILRPKAEKKKHKKRKKSGGLVSY